MRTNFAKRGSLLRLLVTLPVVPAGCLVGSYAMARVLVAANGGFGAGDVSAFVYSTVPFAAALLLMPLIFLVLPKRHPILRVALASIIGASCGFMWTVLNRWMLGPWFGAWSFPVLYCWMVGGALGLVGAALIQTALLSHDATEQALGADSP